MDLVERAFIEGQAALERRNDDDIVEAVLGNVLRTKRVGGFNRRPPGGQRRVRRVKPHMRSTPSGTGHLMNETKPPASTKAQKKRIAAAQPTAAPPLKVRGPEVPRLTEADFDRFVDVAEDALHNARNR